MLRNATVAGKAGMGVPSEGRWTPCFETPLSPAKPAWGYRPKGGGPHASKRHCRRQSRHGGTVRRAVGPMLRNATVAGKAGMGVPSEGRWAPCFETPLSPAKPATGASAEENQLLPPIRPEIDVTAMAPQEVHEPLVIRVGHIEEMDHLPVASLCLRQAPPDDSLDLTFRNKAIGIGSGNGLPKVVHDDFLDRFPSQDVGWQSDRIGVNRFSLRHVVATFDDVLQFANVSRVMISEEFFDRIRRQGSLFTALSVQRFDDMTHQEWDVGPTLSKRGDVNRKDVEAVEKILAEVARTRHRPKVTVSRCDNPGVYRTVDNVAQSTHLLLLKHTQKLHLKSLGSIRNLIQEERSLVRLFKKSKLVGHGRREGSTPVAEHFAFDQVFGKGAAIDGHERVLMAAALFMNRTCHQFFSRTGLPLD